MNENGKFERIDEENERKRKCVETEEINQINLIVLLFSSFLMISDWFNQMNELETKWIDFVTTSFKSFFSEQIPIENFYHIKIHFIQSKWKGKIENETKWMIKTS